MNHLPTDSRQIASAAEPMETPGNANTAIHAVFIPVFAAWASAF